MGDGCVAVVTGLAFLIVDEEALLEVAGLAVRVQEVAEGGAALGDGLG